jgi:hypothetical protein
VGEAEEIKGLRFAKPAGFAVGRRKAANLDQSGLVGMERQGVFRHARFEVHHKPYGLGAGLEPDDGVVGHIARRSPRSGVALSPLPDPPVENIVEIDVGQQRRDDRPLRGAHRRRDTVSHRRGRTQPQDAGDLLAIWQKDWAVAR